MALFYTILMQYDLTALSKQALGLFFKVNTSIFSAVFFGISNILAFMMTLSNMAFNIILYFTLLNYLLRDDNDLVQKLLAVIPMEQGVR